MSRDPRTLALKPIDEAARDGRYRLVFGKASADAREHFSLVRWHDNAWRFSSDHKLAFEPTRYCP